MKAFIDGDVTISIDNSLHRMSMLVHEIRVMDGKTFRFNLADCTPYNADFDGDEMNLHVIQSEEARAEARILMRVQEHIISPRYGGSVIGGIHDHITGAYLLTHGEAFLPMPVAMDVLSSSWMGRRNTSTVERDGQTGLWATMFQPCEGRLHSNFKNRAEKKSGVPRRRLGSIDKEN